MDYIFSGKLQEERASATKIAGEKIGHGILSSSYEDNDFATAMRNSLQDFSEGWNSGVATQPEWLGSDNKQWVPYKSNDIENSWSIVPYTEHIENSIFDTNNIRSNERTRAFDTPVAFRPLYNDAGLYLPVIICALYNIPQVKNILTLKMEGIEHEYTPTENWWIDDSLLPKDKTQMEPISESPEYYLEQISMSLRRLLAFQKFSIRSFGSCEGLFQHLIGFFRSSTHQDSFDFGNVLYAINESLLFVANRVNMELPQSITREGLFLSRAMHESTVDIVENDENDEKIYHIALEVSTSLSDGDHDLDDALDDVVWSGTSDAFISKLADIFCITIKREDGYGGSGVNIPLKINLGRFSENMRQQSLHARNRKNELLQILKKANSHLEVLQNSKGLSPTIMLENAIKISKEVAKYTSEEHSATSSEINTISPKLEHFKASYEQKLKDIEKVRDDTKCELSNIQYSLRNNEDLSNEYSLIAAGINPNEYYFLSQPNEKIKNLIEMEDVPPFSAAAEEISEPKWSHVVFSNSDYSISPASTLDIPMAMNKARFTEGLFLIFVKSQLLQVPSSSGPIDEALQVSLKDTTVTIVN